MPRVLSVNGAYVEAPSPPEPVPEPPRVLSVPVPPPLSGIVVLKPSGLVVAGNRRRKQRGRGLHYLGVRRLRWAPGAHKQRLDRLGPEGRPTGREPELPWPGAGQTERIEVLVSSHYSSRLRI